MTSTTRPTDAPGEVDLVAELRRPCGLSTRHWERDLCVECALEAIGRTWADYVDVEVRIPAIRGAA